MTRALYNSSPVWGVTSHHLGHEQSGIAQVHLEVVSILVQAECHLGGGHVTADVDHNRFTEKRDRPRQTPGSRSLIDGCELEARVMVRKLARDRLEDLRNAVPLIFIVLAQILLVEVENRPLNPIDAGEVVALDEKLYRLRHAADGHVGAEVAHDAAVDGRVGDNLADNPSATVCMRQESQIHEPIDGFLVPPGPLVLMRFQSYYGFNSLPEPLASAGARRD